MSVNKGKFLALFLCSVFVFYAFLLLMKGGFYFSKHEADTLHVLQILLRMGDGEWPHLDFVTPIGVLAFAPISIFLEAGMGVGRSIMAGQVLVAAVVLPAAWWVAYSRFSGVWAYIFGATVLVYVMALVFGGGGVGLSISMHYNRWAWAAVFVAISLVLLPSLVRHNPLVDGIIIGSFIAIAAMIKATFFAAFAPAIVIGLLLRKQYQSLFWALSFGGLATLLMTLWVGTPLFWLGYLRDLVNVAISDIRPHPGLTFKQVMSAPEFIGGSIVALASVVFLRQTGRLTEGLILLLLVPGFFYVTYQNYGNDPKWLWLLALFLMMMRPSGPVFNGFGWDLQKLVTFSAVAAFAFSLPSFVNMTTSPIRHYMEDVEEYAPIVPGSGVHEDLQTFKTRMGSIDVRVAYDGPDTPFASLSDPEARKNEVVRFKGRDWTSCRQVFGMVQWFRVISEELALWKDGQGKSIFVADFLSSYWLYADLERVKGAAPWYYGDLNGIQNADFLFVPTCPMSVGPWKNILETLSAQDWIDEVQEVLNTPYYTIYSLPHKMPKKVDLSEDEDVEAQASTQ